MNSIFNRLPQRNSLDDIAELEYRLAEMMEQQNEFASKIDAVHVRKTTINLAYTVNKLGESRGGDERNI